MIHTRETLTHGAKVHRIMLLYTHTNGYHVMTTHSGTIDGGIFKDRNDYLNCEQEKVRIVTEHGSLDVHVRDLLGHDCTVLCVDPETAKKYKSGELKFHRDAYALADQFHYDMMDYDPLE